jgi:hypothetical protein
MAALVTATRESAQRNEAETRSAATAARSREATEVAERERPTREQAARDQRERKAREAAAREQRERQARQNRDSTPDSAPDPASKPRSNNPYPGYSGPRSYGPAASLGSLLMRRTQAPVQRLATGRKSHVLPAAG